MNLQSLVIARHRHLKWTALDPLEAILMVLCGISIGGFTLSVFCDVVTREIGAPWLWLQLVTTGFFAWGVFIGMAVATRRLDHLNLVEITKGMSGPSRSFMETFNRLVVLVVGNPKEIGTPLTSLGLGEPRTIRLEGGPEAGAAAGQAGGP